jgi:hypothetical protein
LLAVEGRALHFIFQLGRFARIIASIGIRHSRSRPSRFGICRWARFASSDAHRKLRWFSNAAAWPRRPDVRVTFVDALPPDAQDHLPDKAGLKPCRRGKEDNGRDKNPNLHRCDSFNLVLRFKPAAG